MSAVRILLGIICLAVIGRRTEPGGGVLRRSSLPVRQAGSFGFRCGPGCLVAKSLSIQQRETRNERRERLVSIARSQIGVKEATGHNDGARVEAYLAVTKLKKGNPWCAAFVSWVFAKVGFTKPRTAWSPDLFPLARQTLTPKPADVLGIYSIKLKRIAHAGIVERRQNNWIISIEGNTNVEGSNDGDGVYRKWRHVRTIAKFADWVR
jgi:hypothetical protein